MSNTINLYPTVFASAFDEFDAGYLTLPFDVSRRFENEIASFGQKVTVPLAVAFDAKAYTPGSALSKSSITQESVDVELNKSYSVTFDLTDKELSLSPYDLSQQYAIPALEALLTQVNTDIITELSSGLVNSDVEISSGEIISTADILECKASLDYQKARYPRKFALGTNVYNDLLSRTEFQYLNSLGSNETITDGIMAKRYGFDFRMNSALNAEIGYAFSSSAVALACRVYKEPPSGSGAISQVANYKGIPIRIVMKYTDELMYQVQFDILYGVKLVKGSRVVKILPEA